MRVNLSVCARACVHACVCMHAARMRACVCDAYIYILTMYIDIDLHVAFHVCRQVGLHVSFKLYVCMHLAYVCLCVCTITPLSEGVPVCILCPLVFYSDSYRGYPGLSEK